MSLLSRLFHKSSAKKKKIKEPLEVPIHSDDILLKKTIRRLENGRIVAEANDINLTEEDYRDFTHIVEKFEHNDQQVTKVTYIINRYLTTRYLDCQKQYTESGISTEQVFVFHGTEKLKISRIMRDGFKVGGENGHQITHGALYGKGIYTSRYGNTPAAFSYDMCLVGCWGLPGIKGVHHSVPEAHPNWIIFHSPSQILPAFVVYFEKGSRYSPLLTISQQLSYKETINDSQDIEVNRIDDHDKNAVKIMCDDIPVSTLPSQTTKAIQKQLQNLLKVQMNTNVVERGWTLDTNNIERIDTWRILLTEFNPKLQLWKDLCKKNIAGVTLEIIFPENYPQYPPFIRVVSPRLLRYQNGGGGHVTAGGGICMELLTSSGWDPKYTVEGLLQIVHTLLSSKEPPARLAKDYHIDYTLKESKDAFTRVARAHNWVP
jgi:ubiquitin-protein ligase